MNNFPNKSGKFRLFIFLAMEVTNPNSALLSNCEVLALLQEIKEKQNSKKNHSRDQLATIVYETTKYLKDSPSGLQSNEDVQECLKALLPFKLTKAEKLMLINNVPKTPVEIQVIVEDCDDRFTDNEVQSLLDIISRTLPSPDMEQETAQ